jgi:hypothetical protein
MAYGSLALDEIATSGNLAITGDTTVTGNLSAANMSGRNRIINGAMAVDQRNAGASQVITAGAALAYTVDRWYAYSTGANVTGQRVAGSGFNLFAYRFTGAASVTAIGFGQRIESLNSGDMAGTTATLSVELANTLLTTVSWTAFYANTTDTFGTLASPTRTQIATGTFTVNSTLTRYSTRINIPSGATTGIEIVFTVGAQTSGTWTIDNVQLEPGTVATPFERRQIGQELALCHRYFASFSGGLGAGSSASSTACLIKITFPCWMRTNTPTITYSSGNSINVDFFGSGISSTSITNINYQQYHFGMSLNIGSLSPARSASLPTTLQDTVNVSTEL